MGVDYGLKKIGLAISEGELADPYQIIPVNSLAEAVDKVLQVVNKESIDQLIVGMPESGAARKITKSFIKEMNNHLKVVVADETLSTQTALGINSRDEDALAAAIILQNYLDDQGT